MDGQKSNFVSRSTNARGIQGITRNAPSPPFEERLADRRTRELIRSWDSFTAPVRRAHTPKELWKGVDRMIAEALPADNVSLYMGAAFTSCPQIMMDRQGVYERLDAEELHQEFTTSPLPALFAANPGTSILHHSDIYSSVEEHFASPEYRSYLRQRGWDYPVGLFFWHEQRVIGGVCCYRSLASGDFDAEERDSLFCLHGPLQEAFLRVHSWSENAARRNAVERITRESRSPYTIANLKGEIVESNRAGRESMLDWILDSTSADRPGAEDHLPEAVQKGLARINARLNYQLQQDVWISKIEIEEIVEHPDNPRQISHLTLVNPVASLPASPLVLIQWRLRMNREGASGGADTADHDRLFAMLTLREREVVDALLLGLSNKEIAERLHKSVATVKHQLNRSYAKLGVENRKQLMASMR